MDGSAVILHYIEVGSGTGTFGSKACHHGYSYEGYNSGGIAGRGVTVQPRSGKRSPEEPGIGKDHEGWIGNKVWKEDRWNAHDCAMGDNACWIDIKQV